MQYEVYRRRNYCSSEQAEEEEENQFKEMDAFMKQIENEDRVICTHAQKNLNAGVYDVGPLHGEREKGVRYFKTLVKEAIMSHWKEEQRVGHEIWPAQRLSTCSNQDTEEERAFCRELCGSSSNGGSSGTCNGQLSW